MLKLPRTKLNLAKRVLAGETVVAKTGYSSHTSLEKWAIENNLAVYIDRRSEWGNPFPMRKTWRDSTKEELSVERDRVIQLHIEHIEKCGLPGDLSTLKGKILFCHCKPLKCHGDYLAELANKDRQPD